MSNTGLSIKPFSGLYYYNRFSKSNNVSRFLKKSFNSNEFFDANSANSDEFSLKASQKSHDFEAIKFKFENLLKNGEVTASGLPAFYVCSISYKISGRLYEARGIFAILKLPKDDGLNVSFLENFDEIATKAACEFLNNINLQTRSAFALYDDENYEIENLLKLVCEGPCCERAKHLNVSYKVWEVNDGKLIEELQNKFKKISKIYMVKGRDVYDAVLKRREFDEKFKYVLTFFMERTSEVLAVLPFHRIISMNMFNFGKCLNKLSPYFDFLEFKSLNSMRSKMFSLKRDGKCAFGIYAEEIFGVLTLKDSFNFNKEFDNSTDYYLDADVLNKLVVDKLFCLKKSDLQFTNSAKAAKMAVDNGDGCMALFLNSERIASLVDILDRGETLPYKVAGVFPDPVDGLIFYST